MKKVMWCVVAMLGAMQSSWAAEQVWRYVDAKSGQVTYSNVQVKGARGDKVEIMAYPVARAPTTSGGGGAAPIPAEILRQLQGVQRSGALPAGLPPLPSLAGARLPSGIPLPSAPAKIETVSADASMGSEPKWAKEIPAAAGQSPTWAKDPFAPQK